MLIHESAAATDTPVDDTPVADTKGSKAPVGWGPKEREDWSKVPTHIQDRITARESEMAKAMSDTKQQRQVYEGVKSMSQNYSHLMQAEGVNNPMQAIDGMFKTVAGLRSNDRQQQAQTVADMIQHYGVDIGDLDNILSQNIQGQPQQNNDDQRLQALLDERMAPVNQLMSTINNAQADAKQAETAKAQNSVVEFSEKAEFLNDVRMDMADLIDMAASRGQDMSLQQAYDKACAIHPEISKVVEQRKYEEGIRGSGATLQAKRAAASSLNGRMVGSGAGTGSLSMRDTLNAAWDGLD